jgi:hypothetical protein
MKRVLAIVVTAAVYSCAGFAWGWAYGMHHAVPTTPCPHVFAQSPAAESSPPLVDRAFLLQEETPCAFSPKLEKCWKMLYTVSGKNTYYAETGDWLKGHWESTKHPVIRDCIYASFNRWIYYSSKDGSEKPYYTAYCTSITVPHYLDSYTSDDGVAWTFKRHEMLVEGSK